MEPSPEPILPPDGRLVIRPPRAFMLQLGGGLGIVCAFIGFFAIGLLVSGVLAGGILLLIPVLGSVAFFLWVASMRLWADASSVGLSNALFDRVAPRSELAALRIGKPYSRSGPSCNFVRRDGTVAFRTGMMWGAQTVSAFARYLGLPLISDSD